MEASRVEAYFRMSRHVRIYLPMLSGNTQLLQVWLGETMLST